MRTSRHLRWKIPAFLALLVLCNFLLSYALIPATSDSRRMWERFDQEPVVDTVFVGSSLCTYGLNPFAYDLAMGTHSFNMGTPSQMLTSSYVAIETAIRKKKVRTVIYPLWYETLQNYQNPQAEVTFLHARNYIGGLPGNLLRYGQFIKDRNHFGAETSLNILFPWVNDHVQISKDAIRNNVKLKRNPSDTTIIVQNPGEQVEDLFDGTITEDKIYIGHGFVARRGIVDYNQVGHMDLTKNIDQSFDEASMDSLAAICRLCKKNNVDLVVVKTPMAAFDVLGRQETYFDKMQELKTFLAEQGVEYYDFNLARPELFRSYEFYYLDLSQHLNFVGATKFSEALGQFMKLRADNGSDALEGYFYTKEEYLNSIDYISAVDFTSKMEGDDLTISATAYTGPLSEAEYRYSYRSSQNAELVVLQDFTDASSFTWKDAAHALSSGTVTLRVEARVKGDESGEYRYHETVPLQ